MFFNHMLNGPSDAGRGHPLSLFDVPSDAGRSHPLPWLPRINSGARSRLPECWPHSGMEVPLGRIFVGCLFLFVSLYAFACRSEGGDLFEEINGVRLD